MGIALNCYKASGHRARDVAQYLAAFLHGKAIDPTPQQQQWTNDITEYIRKELSFSQLNNLRLLLQTILLAPKNFPHHESDYISISHALQNGIFLKLKNRTSIEEGQLTQHCVPRAA